MSKSFLKVKGCLVAKQKNCNNKVKEWMDRRRNSIGSIFKFDLKETSS